MSEVTWFCHRSLAEKLALSYNILENKIARFDLHSIKIVPNNIGQPSTKEVKILLTGLLYYAEAIKGTQMLEFIKADYENNAIIPLKSVRFQKVANIV
ncbi:12172_t:CDS:2, partial [Gigaspora rosea]